MKAFFDTSVLVAAIREDDPRHEESLELLESFRRNEASCAAHSLAEVYSTLTRLPREFRIPVDHALLCVRQIRDSLTVVALDADEYFQTIESAAGSGVAGGTVYDALIGACALKCRASKIYTWNPRHFELLGETVRRRTTTPQHGR